jgi:hypothetical protein
MLRCVQITNSSSHALNLIYFRQLATSIETALDFQLERIEIVMVIPEGNNLSITKSMVKNYGALEEWKVGETEDTWRENHEHELVRIVHFKKTS